MVAPALIPWNSCGAHIAATLATLTFSFAGHAFFCLFAWLMTVAKGWLGLRRPKAARVKEKIQSINDLTA
jgi:NhaC family Na+:H+ antiporter